MYPYITYCNCGAVLYISFEYINNIAVKDRQLTSWCALHNPYRPIVFEFNVSDSKAVIIPFIYTFDYFELLESFLCLIARVNGMVTRRVSVKYQKYQMQRI